MVSIFKNNKIWPQHAVGRKKIKLIQVIFNNMCFRLKKPNWSTKLVKQLLKYKSIKMSDLIRHIKKNSQNLLKAYRKGIAKILRRKKIR